MLATAGECRTVPSESEKAASSLGYTRNPSAVFDTVQEAYTRAGKGSGWGWGGMVARWVDGREVPKAQSTYGLQQYKKMRKGKHTKVPTTDDLVRASNKGEGMGETIHDGTQLPRYLYKVLSGTLEILRAYFGKCLSHRCTH